MNTIVLENEKEMGCTYLVVNGVRMHIFHHPSGRTNVMIHNATEDFAIDMCGVKVTKRLNTVGDQRWTDIRVIE
jgi:hypothetical protein